MSFDYRSPWIKDISETVDYTTPFLCKNIAGIKIGWSLAIKCFQLPHRIYCFIIMEIETCLRTPQLHLIDILYKDSKDRFPLHPTSPSRPSIPPSHVMRFWCSSIVSEAVISKSAAINRDGLIRLMPLWLSLTAQGAAKRGRMVLLLAAALIDHPSRQEHRVVGPNQCR